MTQTNNHTQRSGFSSGFGVLAATLGSAVGLGNIWMFPYQTGVGGGAGFLLIYLLATLLVGLPLMITEISLGRTTRTDPVNVFRTIAPKTHWWLVGFSGMVAALLIMSFYSVVVGWVFSYVGKGLTGSLLSDDKTHLAEAFGSMVGNPTTSLLMQWLVLLVVGGILLLGVTKGIEAVTKRLMPLLFVLLLIVALTSLSLPNAMAGVKFLFLPDWSKINSTVIFTALGLAFFKLSLGIGSMMIYGSYFRQEQNIPKTALTVMLADLTVSLLAGLAIFPAVFSFGFNPAGGPSLLFKTIPAVFVHMPLGQVLGAVFFILTAMAAIGAMLSIVEVPVAVLHERLNWTRARSILAVMLVLLLLGGMCALSNSSLADVTIFGKNVFDAFDFVASKLMMPLNGLATCIFVALNWRKADFVRAISNNGTLNNTPLLEKLYLVVTKISPLLIIVILVYGLLPKK